MRNNYEDTLRIETLETKINGVKGPMVQIEHLQNLQLQDFNMWNKYIENVATLNNWKDNMALASLKLVSDKKLHYIFKNALSLKTALDLLSIAAHPKEDYMLYMEEKNSLKTRNFPNIESYGKKLNT
ncbi:hypothetical protein DMUE_0282 [Dictyocoela muelleri]|nr:hypothetical protein DMUE_0282 [Dictyocoela muelleri]